MRSQCNISETFTEVANKLLKMIPRTDNIEDESLCELLDHAESFVADVKEEIKVNERDGYKIENP